jgi:hypothetical protein
MGLVNGQNRNLWLIFVQPAFNVCTLFPALLLEHSNVREPTITKLLLLVQSVPAFGAIISRYGETYVFKTAAILDVQKSQRQEKVSTDRVDIRASLTCKRTARSSDYNLT